ncbi:PREDICTED: subtilisin-like protease SBT5.3 isoform X2 [Ipomoea nil]|uniref:subtilisin-like protease SBT5.3 isoform X2 n=1 Tax=Ipomoea nil TaxID=35883 RepID=UPI000900FB0B|nr:PREDICTED: subtilisin-like protease SBT5.3 isoform X2 [Ipomoea nil]
MKSSLCFILPLVFALFLRPTFSIKKSYVVYLGGHSHGRHPSSVDLDRVTQSHQELLGSYMGSLDNARDAIFYSYTRHINGFAAMLEEEQAAEIAKNPKVVSVFLNRARQLHTTRSWEFLGLESDGGTIQKGSIWKKARFGEDTIIGNLDSGVWPASRSFSDEGFGPIPEKWKGICQNENDKSFHCNRKLIGARYFIEGYSAAVGPLNSSFFTPRDVNGHGSHTLSTAGGNFVHGANIFGFGNGTAKGGSPKARVAAYKVCWPPIAPGQECFDADILAGFERAIEDGVDVLTVSLGGDPLPYFQDGLAIGSFHAVKNGIVVVASAGNSGPAPGTVSNVAPWLITVGANTMDRQFQRNVVLGNKKHYTGESVAPLKLVTGKFYPLLSAESARIENISSSSQDALLCKPKTLDPKKVKGKILVCLRGENDRIEKSHEAALAGAVGMILANDEDSGNEIIADAHFLPATHVTYSAGVAIFDYIKKTKNPVAHITHPNTVLGVKPAPVIAAFSSVGPNTLNPEILKPDISAPGVNVIAAYTEATGPSDKYYDKRIVSFNLESGTSMSCPHVAGVVGLLKTLYPSWSPAAIRSAIMTTARVRANSAKPITDATGVKATPFAYGAGHIRPTRAANPGLVYDLSLTDYVNFLCAQGYNHTYIKTFVGTTPYKCPDHITISSFNYPSITIPNLNRTATVTRTVKNVGSPATYTASVHRPVGFSVTVYPEILKFEKVGEEKTFQVTLQAKGKNPTTDYAFGVLTWSDDKKHHVRSPIVVKTA